MVMVLHGRLRFCTMFGLRAKPCLKGPDMFAYILLVHLVRLLHSDPLVLTAAKLDAAGQSISSIRLGARKIQRPQTPKGFCTGFSKTDRRLPCDAVCFSRGILYPTTKNLHFAPGACGAPAQVGFSCFSVFCVCSTVSPSSRGVGTPPDFLPWHAAAYGTNFCHALGSRTHNKGLWALACRCFRRRLRSPGPAGTESGHKGLQGQEKGSISAEAISF